MMFVQGTTYSKAVAEFLVAQLNQEQTDIIYEVWRQEDAEKHFGVKFATNNGYCIVGKKRS